MIDWHAHGMDWALAESYKPSEHDDWTTGDVARAFAAGAAAGSATERERCVAKINKVTAKITAACPYAANGWWPDQVGYQCIQAIQGDEL